MNSNTISLRHVLPEACFFGCQDIAATSVSADSRQIRPGDVFIAIRGSRVDGHDCIEAAVSGGAVAVVAEQQSPGLAVPQCIVACSATAYAKICTALVPERTESLTFAGVTGTNGKTTTTWMLRSILTAARRRTGLIGTIENHDGYESSPAEMTTPPADVLARQFSRMIQRQTSHCVMEVSSHALAQKRCAGVRFSVAAVTNVTQDHFDYHGSAENYCAAKAAISELLHPDAPLVLNLNDAGCRAVRSRVAGMTPVITCGVENAAAELRAHVLTKTHRSQRLRLHLAQGDAEVRLRLIGHHNVENALTAACLAEQLGVRLKDIVCGLEAVHAVPGRLERIDEGQPFQVLVDYAHTSDALARAVETIRGFVPGRLICVFGAGGDRDRAKRPLMGQAAAKSDICIVTSDNPRNEDPDRIIGDVVAGIPRQTVLCVEPDRTAALRQAFVCAEPGDVVLIAGRGHEPCQQIRGQRMPFDDRQMARQLLRELHADDCPPLRHHVFSASWPA